VISLKRYLDSARGDSNEGELLGSAVDSYRRTLQAIGEHGSRAFPGASDSLASGLLTLQAELERASSSESFAQAGDHAGREIAAWGDRTSEYVRQKTGEMREIMLMLARTAESAGERDRAHTERFHAFTQRLERASRLEDLSAMRGEILQSATELRREVERAADENRKAVERLRTELSVYRSRLERADDQATHDALTGLVNRRGMEIELERRFARGGPLSMLMLDLNGFKEVNDTLGHAAGDDLLRRFARELAAQLRPGDAAARWGGDEFVVAVDGGLAEAEAFALRVRQWAFGEYTVAAHAGPAKAAASGAIGVVERQPSESLAATLARADRLMYAEKARLGAAR